MKIIGVVSLVIMVVISSCSSIKNTEVTVVRDCTGTYVRSNEKDYHVCNLDVVKDVADGATVKLDFKKVSACPAMDSTIVCMMYHENEGWVEVKLK